MHTQILSGGTTPAGATGRETASAQHNRAQGDYRAGAKASASFSEFVEQDIVKVELTDAALITAPASSGNEDASEHDIVDEVLDAGGEADTDVSGPDGEFGGIRPELAEGSVGDRNGNLLESDAADVRTNGALPVLEQPIISARTGEMMKGDAGSVREARQAAGPAVSVSAESHQKASPRNGPATLSSMDLKANTTVASSQEAWAADAVHRASFGRGTESGSTMVSVARQIARQASEIPSSQSMAGTADAANAMDAMAKSTETDLKNRLVPNLQVVDQNSAADRRFASRVESFDAPQAQLRRPEGFDGVARFVQNASAYGVSNAPSNSPDLTTMSKNSMSVVFEPGAIASMPDFEGLAREMPGTSHSPGVSSTLRVEASRMPFAQIVDQVVRSPDKSVDIALSPKELGHVRMQLATTDGALTIIVTAERAETTELMRRHMDSLLQEFRKLGFEQAGFEFRQQGQGAQGGDKANTVATLKGDGVLPPEGSTPAAKSPPRALTVSGLDIRI